MELEPEKESLVAEIAAAFDGVPREEGITLHEAEEIDCHGSQEERVAARQLDIDTRWQDVPDRWIEEFSSAYTFMDAKGLRYYLPAVMIWSLRKGAHSDSSTGDNVDWLLLKGDRSHLRDSLIRILTADQCRAIAKWLLFCSSHLAFQPERHIAELRASTWAKYLPTDDQAN